MNVFFRIDFSYLIGTGHVIRFVGTKKARTSLGEVNYNLKSSESASVKFFRSIYFIKDIKRSEIINKDHVKIIRPGYGLTPKYLKSIAGKKSNVSVFRGSPATKTIVEF